ncbi:hypothetical protein MKW98_031618 [Papaver atlanticum]|uniref:Uncharacterized protein n=1 Tax=Papaver atlanticum TaxID=357466 RepID=A0AAD4S631_9MAGN|nr:hypothetical protein MKW98_031618 [Papaver atlanticum]
MEKQIQKVYTHAKFKEFRNQLVRKMYCEIIGVQDEIKNGTLVQKYDIQEEVYYAKPPENEDENGDEDEDDDEIASPNDTTPTEKSDSESESEPEPEVDDDMLMKKVNFKTRYKELCDYFAELADVVSKDNDKCNDIKKWIREQLIAVGKGSGVEMEISKSKQNDVNEVEKFGNPPQVKRKGAPNKNRLKPKQYKKRATKGKENITVDKANLTEKSMIGNVQSSNGAENISFTRGEYGQLLHFAELQRIENIRNTTEQFRAPQRSLYGSVGNAATAYGIPYIHSENGAHTQRVFSGNVDSVAPAFGHGVFSAHVDSIAPAFGGAQPWRSAHLANAAPTNEDFTISLQANLSGWFTQKKN